jgi:uroporphyrinogen decarboxylase
MTSKERVYTRLAGKPVDKIPNMNIFMHIVAREAGVAYREYVQDYRNLVAVILICAEKYGVDAVNAISDPMREASAFGEGLAPPPPARCLTQKHLLLSIVLILGR